MTRCLSLAVFEEIMPQGSVQPIWPAAGSTGSKWGNGKWGYSGCRQRGHTGVRQRSWVPVGSEARVVTEGQTGRLRPSRQSTPSSCGPAGATTLSSSVLFPPSSGAAPGMLGEEPTDLAAASCSRMSSPF